MKKLAENLKLYARELGLSDAEVARRSGLSEVRYGHYVRGRSEPDYSTFLRICRVLSVTPNDLLLSSENRISSRPDENEPLRKKIAVAVRQLDQKQLRMVIRVLDALFN